MSIISELRRAKGMTQDQFSEFCNVSRISIARYEAGEKVSPKNAEKIAAALGISPSVIIGWKEPSKEQKSILHDATKVALTEALVGMLSGFTPEKVQGLINIACLPQEQFQLVLDFVSVLKAANKD